MKDIKEEKGWSSSVLGLDFRKEQRSRRRGRCSGVGEGTPGALPGLRGEGWRSGIGGRSPSGSGAGEGGMGHRLEEVEKRLTLINPITSLETPVKKSERKGPV